MLHYWSHLAILLALPASAGAQEICNNGIDDDGDQLVDLNDPGCPCNTIITGTPSFIPNPAFEEMLVSPGSTCIPRGCNAYSGRSWFDNVRYGHRAIGALSLYNRWGQEVFSTRALAQGWDGAGVPDGTYYFVVTPDDAQVTNQTGHVTLVR